MSPFNQRNKHHDESVSMSNLRITFENLIAVLSDTKYESGIDRMTIAHTIQDLYSHVSGDRNIRIRCPAPMNNLEDKFQFLWPEGARVSSRAPSDTSRASHRSGKSHRLSSKFTSGNIDSNAVRRAMSVTSSHYSKRFVGFIDEEDEKAEDEEEPVYHFSPPRHRKSSVPGPENTIRVNGSVMRPSPSLEQMFARKSLADEAGDNEDRETPEQESRPVSGRHTRGPNRSTRRRGVSNVGFSEE